MSSQIGESPIRAFLFAVFWMVFEIGPKNTLPASLKRPIESQKVDKFEEWKRCIIGSKSAIGAEKWAQIWFYVFINGFFTILLLIMRCKIKICLSAFQKQIYYFNLPI